MHSELDNIEFLLGKADLTTATDKYLMSKRRHCTPNIAEHIPGDQPLSFRLITLDFFHYEICFFWRWLSLP